VYYEHGGIGWHTHVIVLETDAKGAVHLIGNVALGGDKVDTLKSLRRQVRRDPEHRKTYDL